MAVAVDKAVAEEDLEEHLPEQQPLKERKENVKHWATMYLIMELKGLPIKPTSPGRSSVTIVVPNMIHC